ncbi:MAG: PD-(D/E)XK nuclease family protein [Syntrophobacteraceae bacterium]
MEIVLGYELDTGCYPDALNGMLAKEGITVLGPERLVSLLETRLGLSGPLTHHAVRIGQYLNCMKLADKGNRSYSRSLASDAWSTAKAVLAWRDELILGGWNGRKPTVAGSRLQDICEVEKSAAGIVAQGVGDRLQAVLASIKTQSRIDIKKIRLVEHLQLWPPSWQKLLQTLQAQGVELQEESLSGSNEDTCLGILKKALRSCEASKAPRISDGTFGILSSNTEWEAAEALASWLNTLPEDRLKRVLIIRGKGSPLLDGVFHDHRLPGLGLDSRARWRAALQVLPLVLSNLWAPFDPHRLLELLTLPQLPFPSSVAHGIERALRTHPGKGGPEWQKALDYGLQKAPKLQLWLGNNSCNPGKGANAADVLSTCDMVSTWAAKRGVMENDSLLLAVSAIVKSVSEAVLASGIPLITPAQLARILDSTVGEGIENPDAVPQAAPWSQVVSPGQIYGPAETIIWWNFLRPEMTARRLLWTQNEIVALETVGVELEAPSLARKREAEAWRRPAQYAESQLFLVVPGTLDGNGGMHPFWDEIRHLLKLSESDISKITAGAAALRDCEQPSMFGNILRRVPVPTAPLPSPCRQWLIAHPHNCTRPNDPESFSSMEKLLQCPFAWTLHYVLGIRPGNLISLPDGGQMIGTLTHAIIEKLFSQAVNWSASGARMRAGQLYDDMVPEMAVTLLHPGRELERLRYRKDIVEGIEHLVNFLNTAQLAVTGREVQLSKPFPTEVAGVPPAGILADSSPKTFYGRIDLVLSHMALDGPSSGNEDKFSIPHVGVPPIFIDVKWTQSAKHRLEEMKEGKPLQLAAYSWLLSGNTCGFPPGGYYLLPKGEALFSPCIDLPAKFPNQSLDLSQVWNEAVLAYNEKINAIGSGVVHAEGIPEDPGNPLTNAHGNGPAPGLKQTGFRLDTPCNFCDYTNLCGKTEG